MPPSGFKPYNNGFATLLVGDATRTVIASPGAGQRIVVTAYQWMSVVAAAQIVTLESSDAAVVIGRFGASVPVGTSGRFDLGKGVPLPVNTSLRFTPAAAGPSMFIFVEYYTEPV